MSELLVLALDTSTRAGGIALAQGERTWEKDLDRTAAHARTLVPAIESLLRESGHGPGDLQLIAVGLGPGSYTGLRVGIATALTLRDACGCPIVGVSSLEALAAGVPAEGPIVTARNAYGGELYVAQFEKAGGVLRETSPVRLLAASRLGEVVPPGAFLAGDDREPRALDVLRIGLRLFRERGGDDPRLVRPLYLRPSRAEILFQQKKK